ncbi:MAG: Acylphosphate phosphohydrolase / [NiFe] hydrogenase metallocenter assembly protein HypF [Nitrospira sp.]|jgi:hydrogenase maturation protein HypF|nr:Acylphosphate phosphohydrolase / [NiFe] hydrogenase metallocenter assembly protein HypF [Nitrospira sp.]
MTPVLTLHPTELAAVLIRVRGLVQGVGFRPAVWRLAQEHWLRGHVLNDGQGVRIYAIGTPEQLQRFMADLKEHPPTLARIVEVVSEPASFQDIPPDFTIIESGSGEVTTGVVPDAATCQECLREILDPFARRYRYPFTNCTHCGPRLTIQDKIPYDRSGTTMSAFPMCSSCEAEYQDPNDRRFHAQPIACHACGPKVWLERADGKPIAVEALTMLDAVDAACTLLQKGRVVAIKGLGGVQLACDATQEEAISRLRRLKARGGKPFALMAREVQIIHRYCEVSEQEVALLESPAAPIVILKTRAEANLAPSVAPGMRTLGFMLPNTPLHHLILRRMDRPIVLTSGNRSDEPQWIDNEQAKVHLGEMAEYFLLHDRGIAQRVDDSVAKVMGGTARMFRRSRGYAPSPVVLPPGFDETPRVLAMGGELKNTFCLIRDGHAVLSHHIGDLEDALTQADYRRALGHYRELFAHVPQMLTIDRHPDYLSSKIGREMAADQGLPLCEVQHHHAHIAACLAENGIPIDHPPVLGVALDGLGYGDDGTLWGGEFLLADYRTCTRVGTFKPVRMLGGEQAVKEPWRNTYAHLMAEMRWARFAMNYDDLDLYHYLAHKPRAMLDQMLARGINSPQASSCGRLFDAVAAAVGICRDRVSYEGQAAVELEQVVDQSALEQEDVASAYPFTIPYLKGTKLPYIEPLAMWQALLGDLILNTPLPVMAARFHKGLAKALCAMVDQVTRLEDGGRTVHEVALSGGVFQNQILFELVKSRLEGMGYCVFSHAQVPANDGGLALGQAVIAAAKVGSHKE